MQNFDITHRTVDSAYEAHDIMLHLIDIDVEEEDAGIGPYEYGSSRGWDSQMVSSLKSEEGSATLRYTAKKTPLQVMDQDEPFPFAVDDKIVEVINDGRVDVEISYTAPATIIPEGDHYIISQPLSWKLELS